MRLLVKVIPRASKNELAGWSGDILRVRIAAPPVDGEANAALERFIAQVLDLPTTSVQVVAGHRSRVKTLLVKGRTPEEVEVILGGKR